MRLPWPLSSATASVPKGDGGGGARQIERMVALGGDYAARHGRAWVLEDPIG